MGPADLFWLTVRNRPIYPGGPAERVHSGPDALELLAARLAPGRRTRGPTLLEPIFEMPDNRARTRRVRVDGAELFVRRLGSGPPILCLHGGLGLDHTYLSPWLDPLARHHSVVYYDHRGNGRSSAPADWSEVDHDVWAADVERLRLALGLDDIILFGHSYGAFIALEYAARYPDRLAGLILCSAAGSAAYLDAAFANLSARAAPEQLAAISRLFGDPPDEPERVRELWHAALPAYVHGMDERSARAAFAQTRYSGGAIRRAVGECLPAFDVLDRLTAVRARTLVLVGRHDLITPLDAAAEPLLRALPSAELVVLEDSAHFPFIRENDEFLRAVDAWLHRGNWPRN